MLLTSYFLCVKTRPGVESSQKYNTETDDETSLYSCLLTKTGKYLNVNRTKEVNITLLTLPVQYYIVNLIKQVNITLLTLPNISILHC